MKIKSMKSFPVVGGVQAGHMHLNSSNHASSGVSAAMPMGVNIAKLDARKFNAKKIATKQIMGGK